MKPLNTALLAAFPPQPNIATAQLYLDLLGLGESFTFQTIDDDKNRRDRGLLKILHGSLTQHADVLIKLNQSGAGVFVTVNRTDGKGRSKENIVSVRSIFVDLDGSPIEPVMQHGIHPSIAVESSPNRFHAYWLTNNCPLAEFKLAQQRLSKHFKGDSSVCDLPRVMRLPGFIHQKAEPFMTRIIFPE